MDFRKNIEKKLNRILMKLKSIRAIKSFKINIDWTSKEDIDSKAIESLSKLDRGLNNCLPLSKPRRAEIRNVISELVKKKNDMDSRSDSDSTDLGSGRKRGKNSTKPSSDERGKTVEFPSPRAFTCSVCNSKFENDSSLKNHLFAHKVSKTFLCEHCGMQFLRMSTWKYHLVNVHRNGSDKKFKKSTKDFKSRPDGKIDEKEATKFECRICSKVFSVFKNLECHELTHDARHGCSRCSEKFETKRTLNFHVKTAHPREIKSSPKSRSGPRPSFRPEIELENHVPEERGKEEPGSSEQERHVSGSRSNSVRIFEDPRSSENHRPRSHGTGKKAFACDICDKSFFEKGKLNRHLLCHQVEAGFSCDLCRKTFSRGDALKRHVSVSHPNEEDVKSFRCKFCDKAFSFKYNRNVHEENVHIGNGAHFECEICNQKCKNKTTLRIHMKIHSGKMLSCNFCKKIFNRKASYHSHMKKKHPGISPFQTLLDSVAAENEGLK